MKTITVLAALLWFMAAFLWLMMAAVLAELIDLNQCSQLQEAISSFEGRPLNATEQATKSKLEEWFVRAKCNDKKRDT